MPIFIRPWRNIRLLNILGLRHDTIACQRQSETYVWPAHLGEPKEGECSKCGAPIFYERKNWPFVKVCNRCLWEG